MVGIARETAGPRDQAKTAGLAAARWLSLAATPTFALMALLSGIAGSAAPDALCATTLDSSPLNGMVAMYLLMSAFHSTAWLRLMRRNDAAPQSS